MNFNPIQVISIIAIFQSFFMSLHFSRLKKGDKFINIILSLFLAFFAILMIASLSVTEGIEHIFIPYHKAIFLIRQLALLIGPLLYFFIRRSINPNSRFQHFDYFHLIPFFMSVFYYGLKLLSLQQFVIWQSDLRVVNNILILIHTFAYVIISVYLLKREKFNFKISFSGSGNSKLSWIFLIICGTIVVWLIELNSLFVLNILNYYQYCNNMTSLYSASTFIFFNSIAYFVITKPELFTRNRKYGKSLLKPAQKEIYKKMLSEYMEKQKPYLNPSLSLEDIAQAISIPHRSLSQIINESFQQHFYDYVNYYRILESERLLKDQSNGKITIFIRNCLPGRF